MPGFDGTGPRGLGPMTGGSRGFCVLRLPNSTGEPFTGLAGRAGWPVGHIAEEKVELAHLRGQAQQVEAILRSIHSRIERLQLAQRREPIGV